MKKLQITALLIVVLFALSCKTDKKGTSNQTVISNNPLSGTIYKQNFVVNGAVKKQAIFWKVE